jgi:hypothetical protein
MGRRTSALPEPAEAGVWRVHRDVAVAEPPRLVLEPPRSGGGGLAIDVDRSEREQLGEALEAGTGERSELVEG